MKWILLLIVAVAPLAEAQQAATMGFDEYDPKSTLVVPQHPRPRAKYPFIDIHNHQRRDMSVGDAQKLIADMDRINMGVLVNLSGGSGDAFKQGLANLKAQNAKRFVAFANVDFSGIDAPDFATRAAGQLEQDVRNGAVGLKVFKNLGM